MKRQPPARFIKCSEAGRAWGISRTTQWRYERVVPGFPKRLKLGPGLFVYDAADVARFEAAAIAGQPEATR